MISKPVLTAYLMICVTTIMAIFCVGCTQRQVRDSTGLGMSVLREYTEAERRALERQQAEERRNAPQKRQQQLDQQLQSFIRDVRSDIAKDKGKHISRRIQTYGPAAEITSDGKDGSVYKWHMKDIMPSPYWKQMWIDLFYYADSKGIIYHTIARGAAY